MSTREKVNFYIADLRVRWNFDGYKILVTRLYTSYYANLRNLSYDLLTHRKLNRDLDLSLTSKSICIIRNVVSVENQFHGK